MKPDVALNMLLYSYCATFHINPYDAIDTPISMMMDMMNIHGTVEEYKATEMKRETDKMKTR